MFVFFILGRENQTPHELHPVEPNINIGVLDPRKRSHSQGVSGPGIRPKKFSRPKVGRGLVLHGMASCLSGSENDFSGSEISSKREKLKEKTITVGDFC